MATTVYKGMPSKKRINFLVDKYGMQASYSGNVIFKDEKFIVFTSDKKTPTFIDSTAARFTSQALEDAGIDLASVTDIKLPSSVESVAPDAFDNMPSLSAITFPMSTKVKAIEAGTFTDCQSLRSLALGFGTTSIGSGAFQNATHLQSLGLPYTLTSIASTALENAPSALQRFKVVMPYSTEVSVDYETRRAEAEQFNQTNKLAGLSSFLANHLSDMKITQDDNSSFIAYVVSNEPTGFSSSQSKSMLKANGHQGPYVQTYDQTFTINGEGTATLPATEHVPGNDGDEDDPYDDTPCDGNPITVSGSGTATETITVTLGEIVYPDELQDGDEAKLQQCQQQIDSLNQARDTAITEAQESANAKAKQNAENNIRTNVANGSGSCDKCGAQMLSIN